MDLTPPPAAPTADDVRAMLGAVVDPELHASITDLGMVKDIDISPDGDVTVEVALTIAGCPLRTQIRQDVEAKVAGLPGVRDVHVRMVEMSKEERAHVMDRARRVAQDRAPDTEVGLTTRVLAVASGKGGVGKSSVTANLAAALAQRGFAVGVLDADIWGFSIPRMLGVGGRLGGEDGKIVPQRVDVEGIAGDSERPGGTLHVVSMGLLVEEEGTALMWRGLVLAKAFEQFLTDVRWGTLDYLLVDMPPGTGDIQMALARLLPQAEVLVVTTPALAAQKVAVRVADMARRSHVKVAGVVENMSTFVCDHGEAYPLFGEGGGAALAQETGTRLLASIPLEPAVSRGGDDGRPSVMSVERSPASDAFHALADRIAGDVLPPVEMEGCTARMLAAVEAAAGPVPT